MDRTRSALIGQFVWEAVLLVLAGAVVITAMLDKPGLFEGVRFLQALTPIGLAASGFALSLRAGTANLAVPAFAGLSGAMFTEWVNRGWAVPLAILLVAGAALVVGAIAGVVVGLTSLPAWALTLGLGGALFSVQLWLRGVQPVVLRTGPAVNSEVWLYSAIFVVITVGGGALCLVPAVRTALANRVVGGVVGVGVSSALAAAGGALFVWFFGTLFFASPIDIQLVLAAALLGGASIVGGRGGVAGTLLAVTLLVTARNWWAVNGALPWQEGLMVAGAIAVGLVVGLVLDRLGRPTPEPPAPPAPPDPPDPPDSSAPALLSPAA